MSLVRDFFAKNLLPGRLSRDAVHGHDRELERCGGRATAPKSTTASSRSAGSAWPAGTATARTPTRRRLPARRRLLLKAGKLRRHIRFGGRLLRGRNRGLDKDEVVPDHRRRRTFAAERKLPFHVFAFAPFDGRIGR